ncbi:hypothetical protein SF83666_b52050 (plasmid) [Sinorhizobium fredii CCBAU 83666]|nr:hypothetical protein SF83666_b52050 [Sinorhizobium fredii CCBAU 83666]
MSWRLAATALRVLYDDAAMGGHANEKFSSPVAGFDRLLSIMPPAGRPLR